jgi:hypothetical protein
MGRRYKIRIPVFVRRCEVELESAVAISGVEGICR